MEHAKEKTLPKCNCLAENKIKATWACSTVKCSNCINKFELGRTICSKEKPTKRFMEKLKKSLSRYGLLENWLKSKQVALLQNPMNLQINIQLMTEKRLYTEMRERLIRGINKNGAAARFPQQTPQPIHYRLPLLGVERSGKLTILKQMRILHGNGFSHEERKDMAKYIKHQVFEAILTIVEAMRKLSTPLTLQDSEYHSKVEHLQNWAATHSDDFSPELFEYAIALWEHKSVKAAYQSINKYDLPDNIKHFLDQIDTIKVKDYTPTLQDILYSNVLRYEFRDYRFEINRCLFDMYKLNSVRGPGHKHIYKYAATTAFIFIAACDSFDTTLPYSNEENYLQESLNLFKQIINYPWFRYKSTILLLNKQDLLQEIILLGKSKLEDHFPRFSGYQPELPVQFRTGEHPKVIRAKYFIRDEFLNISKQHSNRICYSHFTSAVDTKSISETISDCYKEIQFINSCRFELL